MTLTSDQVQPSPPPTRAYITFSVGVGASFAGAWAQRTAIGWLAWDMTHSVATLGFFILLDLLAALWVAPLSGAITDRTRPYRLLLTTGAGSCILATLLCLLVMLDQLNLTLLWIIALLDASLRGFGQPAQMMAPGLLCEPKKLSQAVASSGVTIALAISIGPALAGFFMHFLGSIVLVFALNALLFLVLATVLWHLRPWLDQPSTAGKGNFLHDMKEGFRYAFFSPRIRQVLLLALAFSLLARPFSELLPAFVGDVFRAGPGLLSALMTAQGAGAVFGAILMLMLRAHDSGQLFNILCAASLGIVIALLVFLSFGHSAVLLFAIAIAGLCHVICNICMQSLCQLNSEPHLRGRVLALYGLIFRIAPTGGAFVMTQLAFAIPLVHLTGGLAILYALLILVAWYRKV